MKIIFNNNEVTGSINNVLIERQLPSGQMNLSGSNVFGRSISQRISIPSDVTILGNESFSLDINGSHGSPISICFEGDPPILEGDTFKYMDVYIYCDLTNPKWTAAQTEWGSNPGGAYTVRWYQKS